MADPVAGRYWLWLARDVVSVDGPEAASFLQGQLSQDVGGLDDGASAWSWLLAPTGKVDALVRVVRRSGDSWLLDTDAGWGDAVAARLQRFKLRTKAEISRPQASVLALRGQGWDLAALPRESTVVESPWPGLAGADVILGHGADTGRPPWPDLEAEASEMDQASYEGVRIEAAQPRMGSELGEKTIPAETGLVTFTVSFTKGCYTGQELVARIDSRGGHAPRRLCRLRGRGSLEPGAALLDGEVEAGTVTSAAPAPAGSGWVGLGYVKRGFEVPGTLSARPGGTPVEVEALPW